MCSENSGLRQAISELVQRCGEALRHGFEPRLESFALRLGLVGCARSVSVVLALVLGESADTGRVVGHSAVMLGPDLRTLVGDKMLGAPKLRGSLACDSVEGAAAALLENQGICTLVADVCGTITGSRDRPRAGRSNMGEVRIPVGSGDLPVYVSAPEQGAPWPGVVVLHDVAGMSEDLRNQTRWLAKAGFLAAAPNLLFRGRMKCLFAIARDLKARQGQTYDDVEAVRTWLIMQPECTGKIGVIGFCMGGGFALLLAPQHGFGAASVNYGGGLPPDAETFLAKACPIVASYGAKDRWTRGVAQQLEQLLTAADIAHDVKEYPEAGHSFLNNPGVWWFNALQVIHIGYHEASAEDARRRIASFLRQHLRS